MRPGPPHPVEPGGIHVLAWITPSVTQQRDEAVYVVLRGRGRELLIKQRHDKVQSIRLGGTETEIVIETAIDAAGTASVRAVADGRDLGTYGLNPINPRTREPEPIDVSRPHFVWLSSENHDKTPGPEVPSLSWSHDVEVER